MMRKLPGACLCLALLLGMTTPGALAAEEAGADTYILMEEDGTGLPPETSEEMPAGEPAQTAAPDGETEEPAAADGQWADADPEDPLYARYAQADGAMALQLDGRSHSDYTPRALNNEVLHKGIDVSAWQGTIDWKSVAAAGVDFVFIRAAYRGVSHGTLATDGCFKANIKGAQAAGLKVGLYIFSQAITQAEAREEARYLMALAADYDIDLPLVLDYEYAGSGTRLYEADLSKRAATDICKAFCDEVEKNGYDSMVYGNPSMLNGSLYASELGRVWLAHYTAKTTYSGSYEYWQCGTGSVNGVSGEVDLDFWFEPIKTPEPESPFEDVGESDWYYGVVIQAYESGIVKGVSENRFGPGQTASRGQVITMLYRMAGEPAVAGETAFTDLTQDYYRDAVCWATENGVVKGYSETSFGPERSISREELATILYRMAGSPAADYDLSRFGDGDRIQSYARDAMAWAADSGILNGYEDGTLRPQGQASRAEVCAMLTRYGAPAA